MVDRAKPPTRNKHKRPPFTRGEIDGEELVCERNVEPARGFNEDYFVTRRTFPDGARYRLDVDCAAFKRGGEKRRRREFEYLRRGKAFAVFRETNAAADSAMNIYVLGKTVVARLDELDGNDISAGRGERTRH